MKIQRDKIKIYQKRIQVVLDREHEIAKQCLQNGDKSRARLALRRRKYQEQLLSKADAQLDTLEQLVIIIPYKTPGRMEANTGVLDIDPRVRRHGEGYTLRASTR